MGRSRGWGEVGWWGVGGQKTENVKGENLGDVVFSQLYLCSLLSSS